MTVDPATGVWSLTGRRRLERPVLPLRGRGLRALDRQRRDQPGDRSLLAQPVAQQRAQPDRRSRRPGARRPPGWDDAREAAARGARGHRRSTSCTCATSAPTIRACPPDCAAPSGRSRSRTPTACGTSRRSPRRVSRTSTCCPPSTSPSIDEDRSHMAGTARRSGELPAGLRGAAGGGRGRRRPGRLQLGLRPVALHGARGQLRDRPRRRRRASSSSARWSQALARSGLRVVMDVVYNHTTAVGPERRLGARPIVPGYYHRLERRRQHRDLAPAARTPPPSTT